MWHIYHLRYDPIEFLCCVMFVSFFMFFIGYFVIFCLVFCVIPVLDYLISAPSCNIYIYIYIYIYNFIFKMRYIT